MVPNEYQDRAQAIEAILVSLQPEAPQADPGISL
jgi:hypothetical protein